MKINIFTFVVGLFFFFVLSSALEAQTNARRISESDLERLKAWKFDETSLLTRAQLCAALPQESAYIPDFDKFSNNVQEKISESRALHALLWSLKRSCSSGFLQIGPSKEEYDCAADTAIPITESHQGLINIAIRKWPHELGKGIQVRCLRGQLSLQNIKTGLLQIENSGLELSILWSSFSDLQIIGDGRQATGTEQPKKGITLSKVEVSESLLMKDSNYEFFRVFHSTVRGDLLVDVPSIGSIFVQSSTIGGSFDISRSYYGDRRDFTGPLNTEVGNVLLWDSTIEKIFIQNCDFRRKSAERQTAPREKILGAIDQNIWLSKLQSKGIQFHNLKANGSIWINDLSAAERIELWDLDMPTVAAATLKAKSLSVTGVSNAVMQYRFQNIDIDNIDVQFIGLGSSIEPISGKRLSQTEFVIQTASIGAFQARTSVFGKVVCEECLVRSGFSWSGWIINGLSLLQSRVGDGINLSGARFSGGNIADLRNVQARYLAMTPDSIRPYSVRGIDVATSSQATLKLLLGGAKFDFITGGRDTNLLVPEDGRVYLPSVLSLPSDQIIDLITPANGVSESFDPQPFAMLAKMLADGGNRDAASDIHVARIWRQLTGSDKPWNKIKGIVGYAIGYGYKPDAVLGFLASLTLVGTIISWWMLSIQRRAITKNWKKLPWPIRLWRQMGFVVSDFFVSIVHLVPSVFGSWSASSLPQTKKKSGKEVERIRRGQGYFKWHTVLGSLFIFLLLTPATGIFD